MFFPVIQDVFEPPINSTFTQLFLLENLLITFLFFLCLTKKKLI